MRVTKPLPLSGASGEPACAVEMTSPPAAIARAQFVLSDRHHREVKGPIRAAGRVLGDPRRGVEQADTAARDDRAGRILH
jgi:hypothetical protein